MLRFISFRRWHLRYRKYKRARKAAIRYDQSKISFANSVGGGIWRRFFVRAIEWGTGKHKLLARFRRFERFGMPYGHKFWRNAFRLARINLLTPAEQIKKIPKTGPLVIVSNHPFGLIDGMILCNLIGEVRRDYKILSRWFLAELKEVEDLLIPVSFRHDEDSLEKNLEMRRKCMEHLKNNGVIMLFPAGMVACANRPFGKAIEHPWNPFTAKMIRRSRATVIPIFFPGQNSIWFHIGSLISPILRQSLMIHEVVKCFDRPQKPVIGDPITPETIAKEMPRNATSFTDMLRKHTLALGDTSNF